MHRRCRRLFPCGRTPTTSPSMRAGRCTNACSPRRRSPSTCRRASAICRSSCSRSTPDRPRPPVMPSRQTAPSLFADVAPALPAAASAPPVAPVREAASLLDLLYDGFYMVFLLRRGQAPSDAEAFRDRIKRFLAAVEQGGRAVGASTDDVHLARFAYCALIG